MPEMHLKKSLLLDKSGFTYSVCGWFTKSKEKTQKFKETQIIEKIYENESDKAYLQDDFKDLGKRTASDKVLRDKTLYC